MKSDILLKILIRIIIPSLVLYFGILWIFMNYGYSAMNLIKDNKDLLGKGIIYGLISNIGIALWLTSSIIILKGILKRNYKNNKLIRFYYCGIITSLWLFFLDLFDFHNSRLQNFHYSILFILASFIIFQLIFLKVASYNFFVILFSYLSLGISVLIDITQGNNFFIQVGHEKTQVIEEAFKFVGIVLWLNFWFRIMKTGKHTKRNFSTIKMQ